MEKWNERLTQATRAIKKLEELAHTANLTEIERDALIQRFAFSYELVCKCAKDYLRLQEGLDAASPRRVVRDMRMLNILSEDETRLALRMVDDRNLTVHTYDEAFAEALSKKIACYTDLLKEWLARLSQDVV